MQRDAGGVFGKNSGLQRPNAMHLGFLDQRLQQRFADAAATYTETPATPK